MRIHFKIISRGSLTLPRQGNIQGKTPFLEEYPGKVPLCQPYKRCKQRLKLQLYVLVVYVQKSEIMAEEKTQEEKEIAALPELETDDTDGPASGPGFVYRMAQSGTNYFKVGRSVDPDKRLSSLQTGQPKKLIITKRVYVKNMLEAEKHILEKMEDNFKKTPGGKEWFNGNPVEAEKLFTSIANRYI